MAARATSMPMNPRYFKTGVSGRKLPKSGSLKGWEWQKLSETEAIYTEAKFIDDTESSREFNALMGNMKLIRKQAVKIWPPVAGQPACISSGS
jgi:hypothetical protein